VFTSLGGALYIPEHGQYVIALLESQGMDAFLGELERLSKLGASWATAVLGYRCLLIGPDGQRNPKRAIELCSPGAATGDPYSRFVVGWAYLFDGRSNLGIDHMRRAAVSGFLPAKLDYSTFVWNGWGTKALYSAAAMKLVQIASREGHKGALIWQCTMFGSGRFGVLRQLLGYALMPFARLRYMLAVLSNPYSRCVFLFQPFARRSS